ncbi:MAG: hypothetical protein JWP97_4882 [Labilithrix sp.]|nr:hypothetical protein [Labilithrix sp.]
MRLRELFFTSHGAPRLLAPALVTLLLTFALGWAALRGVQRTLPDDERAAALSHAGRYADAEALYVQLLAQKPDVSLVVALLENHHHARMSKTLRSVGGAGLNDAGVRDEAVMSEEALDDLLENRLPPDVSLVSRFWRGSSQERVPSGLREAVVIGAEQDPPRPWHNRALAVDAVRHQDLPEAAQRYEREGLAFPERSEDVDHALSIWIALGAWDHASERLLDPRVAAAAGAGTRYRIAVHERQWRDAVRFLLRAVRPRATLPSLVMAGVSALAWAFFCARLGKLGEHARRRVPLYVAAFVLGVLSVVPTVGLIAVEEAKLRLVETGEPLRDALFFVFGVGLREEASKLLLFLPLLPVLRRWGDRLDVLVCGALVGLGFASEENLGYLASGDLSTGIGRFLTANFMHMAMTAILAAALDDLMRDREKNAADFSRIAMMVVGLHGAYDFLLSHEEYGGSYLAMAVLFFLVGMFLTSVDHARRTADRGVTVTQSFVLALSVVTGTSAVYAVAQVGLYHGLVVMTSGLLGVAILIYAFVRSLRGM